MWDGDVAQQGAGVGVDNGQVCVITLECGEEGEGDCVGGVDGEGSRRVEIFYGGLCYIKLGYGHFQSSCWSDLPLGTLRTTWR